MSISELLKWMGERGTQLTSQLDLNRQYLILQLDVRHGRELLRQEVRVPLFEIVSAMSEDFLEEVLMQMTQAIEDTEALKRTDPEEEEVERALQELEREWNEKDPSAEQRWGK